MAVARSDADAALAVCVAATSGGWPVAIVMFVGVTVAGWWFRRRAIRATRLPPGSDVT